MSKIETTSKVSLKLTSTINLERRGARSPSSRLWQKRPPIAITDDAQNRNHKQSPNEARQQHKPRNAKPPPPTGQKRPPPGQQRSIAPTGTTNNPPPPRTAKATPNGNHRTMPKAESTSKAPLKPTSRIKPGRWGAHTPRPRLWTPPTTPPAPSLPAPRTARKGLNRNYHQNFIEKYNT